MFGVAGQLKRAEGKIAYISPPTPTRTRRAHRPAPTGGIAASFDCEVWPRTDQGTKVPETHAITVDVATPLMIRATQRTRRERGGYRLQVTGYRGVNSGWPH